MENAASRVLIVATALIALLVAAAAAGLWISVLIVWGAGAGWAAFLARRRSQRDARPLSLEVIERRQIDEAVIVVRLAAASGRRLPRYQPGQYVTVLAATLPETDVPRRRYSLAAWRPDPRSYELCIRREPGGRVSPWLHRELRPGCKVEVLPPRGGCFVGFRGAGEIVLVAGGVGIAPLRAMLHWATRRVRGRSADPRVVLFHAARSQRSLCYRDEFRRLAQTRQDFRFYPIVSRPDDRWEGVVGRLTADSLLGAVVNPERAQFYLCGPPGMLASLAAGLRGKGIGEPQIHCERFLVAKSRGDDRCYRIDLDGGPSLWFRGQRTLLEALTDNEVAIPSECRTGECGACRVRLVSGEVETLLHSTARRRRDEILPCCCVPRSDLHLEIPRARAASSLRR